MRCTTSPRCPTSPSPAPAARRHARLRRAGNGNLATAVSALQEIATADGGLTVNSPARMTATGALRRRSRSRLARRSSPAPRSTCSHHLRKVAQSVYRDLSFDQLDRHFDEIFSRGYSVSVFTDWREHRATQVWIESAASQKATRTSGNSEIFGAKLSTVKLHPLADHPAVSCTEQEGIPGPLSTIAFPISRIGQTPSSGQELAI